MTKEQLEQMKAKPGLYLLEQAPGEGVPLYVDEHGRVWAMTKAAVLSDDGWNWHADHKVQGPLVV